MVKKDNKENKENQKMEEVKKTERDHGQKEKAEQEQGIGEEEKHEPKKKHPSYKTKYEELQDRFLRLSAEFDNYRKRTLREKADLTKFAAEGVILSLLPVIDDFDRAIEVLPENKECNSYKEGITLIYNKLKDFLKQNDVKETEVMHQNFDADLHEAVTKVPASDEKLKGKVIDVLQKGYTLKGKVLRYAKVVIGE